MYDVETYTDPELLDILDLNNPTDRELEAKIVSLIRKYENMQNESGNKLAKFFDDIYKHFFDLESDDESDDQEIIEGLAVFRVGIGNQFSILCDLDFFIHLILQRFQIKLYGFIL